MTRIEKESNNATENVAPVDCYGEKAQLLSVFDSASTYVMTKDSWIMSTGSTHHLCMNRELFVSLDESKGGVVEMNNRSTVQIRGVGTVAIKMFDGRIELLEEVRYVPGLIGNFISVGVLANDGYTIVCGSGMMNVMKGGFVMKAKKVAGLFVVSGETEVNSLSSNPEQR